MYSPIECNHNSLHRTLAATSQLSNTVDWHCNLCNQSFCCTLPQWAWVSISFCFNSRQQSQQRSRSGCTCYGENLVEWQSLICCFFAILLDLILISRGGVGVGGWLVIFFLVGWLCWKSCLAWFLFLVDFAFFLSLQVGGAEGLAKI